MYLPPLISQQTQDPKYQDPVKDEEAQGPGGLVAHLLHTT